jgi:hypothetical protein
VRRVRAVRRRAESNEGEANGKRSGKPEAGA